MLDRMYALPSQPGGDGAHIQVHLEYLTQRMVDAR